jgi:phosphatidylinositol 3-kinase
MIEYQNEHHVNKKILYKKDNVEDDAYMINILRILHSLLADEGMNISLVTYDVLPLNKNKGCISVVMESETVREILETSTLTNYMLANNLNTSSGELLSRYTWSLAFWTVITYIFGIGDRHLDNIMITKEGILFHIDYGFLFGRDPSFYMSPIRLDARMIETMGGMDKYDYFKKICTDIFLCLRKHYSFIYTLLVGMKVNLTQDDREWTSKYLINVLFIGQNDNEATTAIQTILDRSNSTWSYTFRDYVHDIGTNFKTKAK